MRDMISLFKDKAVVDKAINVVMINSLGKEEDGLDNNGVFLDALSAFWNSFYDSCTNGEDERVPVIRHDFQVPEWEAIARIIVKGYQQVGLFPIKLSKAFTTVCLFGEEAVKEDLLLESFLAYLSNDERELVNLSLNGQLGEEQENEWFDLLESFDCKTVPKAEQVKDVVLEIAHKGFIQTPRYIVDSWSTPLSALHREFPTTDSLLDMFARGKPTSKKIISLFDANPETRAQGEALSYLKRYVRGMEDEKLTKFLRFCTGSNMVCVEKITINFNNLEGAERRPVAHTCGAVLDLPATYPSFPLFREEWNSILSSEYWDIDFV